MAQQEVDSKVGDLTSKNREAGLSVQDKQLPPVPVKKTPLRDLQNENNIVAQKGSSNPLILKEVVVTEVPKVSGVKRPSPDSPMSPHQQSSSNSGANSHLVYVRRKSEAETGKVSNNEASADNDNSSQPSQLGNQEDGFQSKPLITEPQMLPSQNPACATRAPSVKPSVPLFLGISNTKMSFEELKTQAVPSAITSPVEGRVKEQNWEERYVQLQMYLKKLDESSLEDHLQCMLLTFHSVHLF
jgi:hypothetical protein